VTTTKEQLERSARRDRGGDVHLASAPQLLEYEAAVERIAAGGHRRLLDWGCGYGQISHMLKARGLDVDSLEFDPEATEGEVRPLERYPDVQARFTTDPVRLPYEDQRFDAVVSMGVLEHVEFPERSLEELHRVLAPGGVLYVYKLPNRASYLEWIGRRAGFYYHGMLETDAVYTLDSARSLVARKGFEVLEARRANMLPLSVPGPRTTRHAKAIWRWNTRLARVPGLNRLATNVELVARRA